MEFKQLQSYVAVIKAGSFTRAADMLYISQPTISTHIRQMEEELHTRLIIRTTKNIEVTPKGRELYEYAVTILELRERMIRNCSLKEQKIIHLGASTIPSAYILPEVLPDFGSRYPDTYFVIHQSDSQGIVNGLLNNMYDLGLIGMRAEKQELECIPFCQDRMVLIAPVNEHFLKFKRQEKVSIKELLQEPIILREKGSGTKKSADQFLKNIGVPEEELHVIARVNDQEAIKNLVAGGLGISIISEKAAHNFLEEKRLLMFDLSEHAAARNLYLVFRKDYILNSQVRDFVEFLKGYYSGTALGAKREISVV